YPAVARRVGPTSGRIRRALRRALPAARPPVDARRGPAARKGYLRRHRARWRVVAGYGAGPGKVLFGRAQTRRLVFARWAFRRGRGLSRAWLPLTSECRDADLLAVEGQLLRAHVRVSPTSDARQVFIEMRGHLPLQ